LTIRTIFREKYISLSSSLCSFLHSPATLSLLGPNILLSSLFANTLSLHSSLNNSDQVSHPYKTTGKISPCGLVSESTLHKVSYVRPCHLVHARLRYDCTSFHTRPCIKKKQEHCWK
jgi:hypothetical protein